MPSFRSLALAVASLGLAAVAVPSQAFTTYRFDSNSAANCQVNCALQNQSNITFESTNSPGEMVNVSGWGSNNGAIGAGTVQRYGGGLGAFGPGSDNQHGVDNIGNFDLILLDFGLLEMTLEQITVGYYQTDADVSVLAYTGDPNNYSGINGISYSGTSEGLTGSGWTVIGNYDVDGMDPAGSSAPQTADISADTVGIASSYWLIGAYNPVFQSAGCQPHANYCQANSQYPDYFKIENVAGTTGMPPVIPNVPEPYTALLLLTALPLLRRARK